MTPLRSKYKDAHLLRLREHLDILKEAEYEKRVQWVVGVVVIILFTILAIAGILLH